MRLREHLEKITPSILDELEGMAFMLEGKDRLARLAETICYEPELARILGEIFDVIGAFGRLEIRTGQGRTMEREYIEGMYWNGGLFSREMASSPGSGRAQLEETAILATDLDIKEPEVVLHILTTALGAQVKTLFLIARTISEGALAILLMKPNRDKIKVVAVKAPGTSSDDNREGLEDVSILTGGRAFFQASGEGLKGLQTSDFGLARRAWADKEYFGIAGGKGDPRRLRQHLATLRAAFAQSDDPGRRKRLQERIGKLLGGAAVLKIGHPSPISAQARKELAERTAEAMRGAMRSGVLPGGGIALLACQPSLLEKYHRAEDPDERAAYRILARAVEAPLQALLENAGKEPAVILAQIAAAGPGCGYDVLQGKIVAMQEAGILDSAAVIREAIYRAIHGAALALTVDVLVHRSNPPAMYHKP